ncbi:hypothetical protein CCMA1212_006819 [Trichoderma ghanense]|uniref:Uncharacterized protein n=1 Tax=Trichoderma ghanense TaxID=65468 RepID=A0ABY2GYP4_9HYPO
MLLDANGPDARAATAVRDTERLVQVEVADVGTQGAGRSEPDLGVHVGAVHVDEAAVLVNNVAHLADLGLKDTKGAGVRDHDGAQLGSMLLALGLEIFQVEVASLGVTLDGHDAHANHGGGRRVRAVSGHGDQADVALGAGLLLVILADGPETGEFTLSTRVGLQGRAVHAGQGSQLGRGGIKESLVALGAAVGRVRVNVGYVFQTNKLHLRGAVELHGAGAEGNHGVDQGQILGLKVVHVAQHLRLAVVRVEDGVGEELGLSSNRRWEALDELLRRLRKSLLPVLGGHVEVGVAVVLVGHRLEGLDDADVELEGEGGGHGQDKLVGLPGLAAANALIHQLATQGPADNGVFKVEGDGVGQDLAVGIDGAGRDVEAVVLGGGLDHAGVPEVVDGHLPQLLGAVVDGVHGRHVGQESLRGADVAGGLFASDVLLSGLQSQTEGLVSSAILGHANQAARQTSLAALLNSHEGGMRPSVAQGNTESLGVSKGNVGTPLAGRRQESQVGEIGGGAQQGALRVSKLGKLAEVGDTSVRVGILHHDANQVVAEGLDLVLSIGRRQIQHLDVDAESLSTAMHDPDGGVVHQVGHHIRLPGPLLPRGGQAGQRHGHGLAGGGALVEQAGVGHGQARQVGHHGLEVEQRLEAALADLGLVGRVAGVPGRVLEDVALDDGGDLDGVVAAAVHPDADVVGGVHALEGLDDARLAEDVRLDRLLGRIQHVGRDHLRHEGVERLGAGAQGLEHLLDLVVARANVAGAEVLPRQLVGRADLAHLLVSRVLLQRLIRRPPVAAAHVGGRVGRVGEAAGRRRHTRRAKPRSVPGRGERRAEGSPSGENQPGGHGESTIVCAEEGLTWLG